MPSDDPDPLLDRRDEPHPGAETVAIPLSDDTVILVEEDDVELPEGEGRTRFDGDRWAHSDVAIPLEEVC